MAEEYDPKAIEPKWQKRWLDENLFAAAEHVPKRKMYVLDMFPYPSGDGLHVGHAKIYTASDVIARYLRMRGYNVLHPTGWDAFGLPTENSAIKFGVHPAELTKKNVDHFRQQMQRLGLSYDWDREINTADPNYYKWTQWIFLQLFKMGLAYQATVPINWCPSCKTGLANEEVIKGKCERCGAEVEQRPLRQWLLRITKYASRLLEGLGGLDWPDFIIELQKNWIGRSEGIEVEFAIEGSKKNLPVFTTRIDTLFGATYMVLSPDHSLVDEVVSEEQKQTVEAYRHNSLLHKKLGQADDEKEKTGVFSGGYAINPANKQRLPIWVADYVVMSYGTGAIMAVPAHDERDFAFAKKHKLPIVQVITSAKRASQPELPYMDDGVLTNSGNFDGQTTKQAQRSIYGRLQLKGKAKKTIHTKLRDWVFSRQRYWGEPIPIIHCDNCGVVAVPEKDLPVELPPVKQYQPTGTGESPLAAIEEWVNVKCPTCPSMGKRETNTMPQWAGSSWYWLRYLDSKNDKKLVGREEAAKWMPVDLYIGGAEHAVLHLLYARFWSKVLFDLGVVQGEEPFQRLRSVGLVVGEDGHKMSKSRGNVINPDDMVDQYGADTLRVYEMFMGPFEASVAWDTNGVKGIHRFLRRVYDMVLNLSQAVEVDDELQLKEHQTTKRVTESTENFRFNTAISALMEFLNALEGESTVPRSTMETFVLLLSPYAPHLCEELWQHLGHGETLMYQIWPKYDDRIISRAKVSLPVQVNGKVRGVLTVDPGASQEYVEQRARQLENVSRHLVQGQINKVVYVPDKLLNFVVKTK